MLGTSAQKKNRQTEKSELQGVSKLEMDKLVLLGWRQVVWTRQLLSFIAAFIVLGASMPLLRHPGSRVVWVG
jgi:hypothetical protein